MEAAEAMTGAAPEAYVPWVVIHGADEDGRPVEHGAFASRDEAFAWACEEWPDESRFYVARRGSFVYVDGGELNLGVVWSSGEPRWKRLLWPPSRRRHREYAAAFIETFTEVQPRWKAPKR